MTSNLYGITATPETLKSVADTKSETVKGFKFPFGGESYVAAKSSRGDLVKSQIKQLIFTRPGERVMLPEFGMNLDRYLFNPLDDETLGAMYDLIVYNMNRFLPFITLIKLEISKTQEIKYAGLPGVRVAMVVSAPELTKNLLLEFDL